MRRARLVGFALHLAYVVALIGAAIALYVNGHRTPSGPLADWAGMDAALSTIVAGAVVVFAGLHALAAFAWFGNPANRWVLATTLPLAGYLVIVWYAYDRTDLVGWQVVVTGLLAAAASVLIGPRSSVGVTRQ